MSFNAKLAVHLDSWVEKGIINQKQRVLIKNEIDGESSTSIFFTIVATIGALFIGCGTILLISANWEYLPKFIKLILILAMPIVSILGGYYLSYIQKEYKKIGDSLIFLGSALIGGSLALLGQLYHLDGSITGLLTWWLILSLPLTLILKFNSIATLNIVLFYLILFFSFEDKLYGSEETILLTFSVVSALVTAGTVLVTLAKNKVVEQYLEIINVFKIISIKVLLGALFIGTLDDKNLNFFGEGTVVLHHIVFLIVLFGVIWEANRTYNVVLRHITFIWLGLFMFVKYFAWFWTYMDTGISFVLFGIFLMGIVYAYLKGIKYLSQLKSHALEVGKKGN